MAWWPEPARLAATNGIRCATVAARIAKVLPIQARPFGVEPLIISRTIERGPSATPEPTDDFWALVRQLPPRQAAAVALHYLEDRPVTEVATILGCAEGTAKAHLHKGRAALARLLEHPEASDGP